MSSICEERINAAGGLVRTDFYRGDTIDRAAGQHQVAIRRRHHVADDASTRGNQKRLDRLRLSVETHERILPQS